MKWDPLYDSGTPSPGSSRRRVLPILSLGDFLTPGPEPRILDPPWVLAE